ncbi:OprO/OprP family phosphate-selective porin [Bacteroidales bacterium OttesenSCG-928-B11]|nr:OprO/OprP family phosphate-selective porin [Bacteroidales bacterium OttesenSCG-928-E04]MDL2308404.1 OprO/OprP family phosphate-selective porin [Bacteroidales bacterium OttesenSCG-928-C03]MDL2311268.1 OprO/OprP family phosphate-selective porin [Bacteroidales bacterium OttesenSCG-928-B11]
MKHNILKIIFLSFILLLSSAAFSQGTDSTNHRLEKLEKVLSKLPKISGFVNFRYQYSENMSTFDIRRARLDFKGDLSPIFDYRLQVEFASNPTLLDGYMRAKIKPWLHIQAGEFKIPFTLENPYSPLKLEFIDMPSTITRFCSYQDLSGIRSNGRDVGVMVSGSFFKVKDFYRVEYALGVFNGSGINVRDNNKSKDVVGRINFYPIKDLTLSISGYVGEMVLDNQHLYARRDRWSGGIRYENDKWSIRTEYVGGNTAGVHSDGVYALAGYTFFGKLMPALRYDLFREDVNNDNSIQMDYAVAINYQPYKFLRCQLNYTYKTYADDRLNENLIGVMVSAIF